MKLVKKIILGGMILGALAGCNGKNDSANKPLEETVKGEPISVQVSGGVHLDNALSVVIKTEKGKYLLCYSSCHCNVSDFTNAAVLIESEMKDGDNQPIEIIGYKQGNMLKMNSIFVNGYKINVK